MELGGTIGSPRFRMEGIKYEDPNRLGLIEHLKKEGKKQPIWARLAEDMASSRKNRSEVNLDKISMYTEAKDTVVIAGKLLGNGVLSHEVTIACYKASESAKKKVADSKGKIITIAELLAQNPKGTRVKILK